VSLNKLTKSQLIEKINQYRKLIEVMQQSKVSILADRDEARASAGSAKDTIDAVFKTMEDSGMALQFIAGGIKSKQIRKLVKKIASDLQFN